MFWRQSSRTRQRRSSDPHGLHQMLKTLREDAAPIHLNCVIRYELVRVPIEVQRRFLSQPVTTRSLLKEARQAEIIAQHPHSARRRFTMHGNFIS